MQNHIKKYGVISNTSLRHLCFDCNLFIYLQNNLIFSIVFPSLKIDRLSCAVLNITAPCNNNTNSLEYKKIDVRIQILKRHKLTLPPNDQNVAVTFSVQKYIFEWPLIK